ncbi:MAG: shikimate kinase [Acutalibacteraceae bacterium]
MKNIILCGFMGCGKTTVGKVLAKKAGLKFIDTDELIENRANMKISDIFDKKGEDAFRDLEHEICVEISKKSDMVVSTGGGVVTFLRNTSVLKENGNIVLLDVPLEILKERLKNDTTRPLLQKKDKDRAIEELFNKRIPIYRECADFIVDGNRSPILVSGEIMRVSNHK